MYIPVVQFVSEGCSIAVDLQSAFESHGSTRNEYCDEASFHQPMKNRTEDVNPRTKIGPVTTKSTTLTNERSRSSSRAQLTALFNEAVTPCVTDSLPSASKINISTRTLIT
ncbi:hypothetical protein FHG87_001356 [Trinorchestia longiramus]|nr:hypothetical protein FHG87_001356 [Trinorchestia longiramus]